MARRPQEERSLSQLTGRKEEVGPPSELKTKGKSVERRCKALAETSGGLSYSTATPSRDSLWG